MPSTRVILVRHGTTAYNADTPGPERIRGYLDVPLATKGIGQSLAIGESLADYPATKIYTSDLQRAYSTAAAVYLFQPGPKPTLAPTENLRPWNVGVWSGAEISKILPSMKKYMTDLADIPVEGGESFNTFLSRFLGFFKDRMLEAMSTNSIIICVTHTRNLRAADGWVRAGMVGNKIDPQTVLNPSHLEPGCALSFKYTGKAWLMSQINPKGVSSPRSSVAS